MLEMHRGDRLLGAAVLSLTACLFSGAGLGAQTPSGAGTFHRASAGSPAPGTIFLYPERIHLRNGELAMAERGMMFVPANRSKPNSEIIGIEVYRFRAAPSANPRTPPIFMLHGGPSFQGLERNLENPGYYEQQIQPYLQAADYVVVGQRGIGSSKPTTVCARPDPVPLDASAERRAAAQREAAAKCRTFWSERGLDLSGFTVLEAADDVDDVRRALGYDQIQIWGGSFGSHWAMTLMRKYPQTVARALLRGLEGPDHTYDPPTGVLNAIARIAAAADTATALRGRIPEGGLLEAFKVVIGRVERQPVMVTITDSATGVSHTVRVDGDAVRAVAYAGNARSWPANVLALHAGDYTLAARTAIRSRLQPGYQVASYYMLDCGSGITPARSGAYLADTAIAVLGDINWSYRTNCTVWESDLGDEFRTYFETSIPTVFVHGDWDLSTPLENARELQPYFKNLKFMLVKGGSHGSLAEAMAASPAVRTAIVRYFATGDMSGIPNELALPSVNWVVPARQPGR